MSNDAECTSTVLFTVTRTVALIYVWKVWLPAGGLGNGRCCSRTLLCCKLNDSLFHPENEGVRRKRQGHCSIECESYRVSCPFFIEEFQRALCACHHILRCVRTCRRQTNRRTPLYSISLKFPPPPCALCRSITMIFFFIQPGTPTSFL
jgi:hypothetical protein